MFIPRSLFAVFLCALIVIATFFKFPGFFMAAGTKISRLLHSADEYVSSTAISNNYSVTIRREGLVMQYPPLPDIGKYTVENIMEMAPAFEAGKISVRDMIGLPGLREFIKKDGRVQRLRLSQREVNPVAIVVESGKYDFPRLAAEVERVAPGAGLIQQASGKYLVRAPILVAKGASLTIPEGDYLLSKEQTVFIANAGDLYILRAKISGWSEKDSRPASFEDRLSFRPFLVSWSGARMYIAGSSLAHLGYRKGKSYGITYSSCEPCTIAHPGLAAPTGALVGNTFKGLYYGFYSYEAEDIAIVGNTYADNIIYGIDPHDRSRRLIIAENDVYGSSKKHGIIISREVNDSWIFNNNSHDNHGSGIMIDRASERNIIANNISARNLGDGLTFFESPNNVLFNNQIYWNGMSGIRIRNSWNLKFSGDQITDNGRVPVTIYSMSLAEAQKDRDLKVDPYEVRAGAEFSAAIFKIGGGRHAFKIEGVETLALSNVHVLSAEGIFAGRVFEDETDIRRNMTSTTEMVIVKAKPAVRLTKAGL